MGWRIDPATESLIPYLRAALDAVAKAPEQAPEPATSG
jgi:hypothetical protein